MYLENSETNFNNISIINIKDNSGQDLCQFNSIYCEN
jgi:hypothetical protein